MQSLRFTIPVQNQYCTQLELLQTELSKFERSTVETATSTITTLGAAGTFQSQKFYKAVAESLLPALFNQRSSNVSLG